jgi:hypothetical protein
MTASRKKPVSRGKPAPRPRSARVLVRIDRELRRKWLAVRKVLRATARGAASAFDERWEAVAEVLDHDPPLFLAGGYASAAEFLRTEVGETLRTARRNVRVARYASPAEEARYGVSKLDAVLSYLEARTGPVTGNLPVDFGRLRIPVRREDGAHRLAVAEATVDEIRSAVRALQRAAKRSSVRASPIVRAVTAAFSRAPLRGIRIRLAGGSLSFTAVPVAAVAAFAAALAAVRLPPA